MSSVVIVGAGREGKGFLGEVFSAAGWSVGLLDSDSDVVRELREPGHYTVKLFTPDGVSEHVVSGYEALTYDDLGALRRRVDECDLIALCLYPEDIGSAARSLAPHLAARAANRPDAPLAIIACTNKNHILPEITASFRDGLPDSASRDWFDNAVAVRDTIVRRSVGAESNRALELEAQVSMSLLIQEPLPVDLSSVQWMEIIDNLEVLKDVKLYTYNAPHAACAYAGYLAGYDTINEAMAQPAIAARSAAVLDEAIQGVSKQFQLDATDLRTFSTLPRLSEDIVDYIRRVAYDPIRKLAGNERLVGIARFCVANSVEPRSTIQTIVDALHYDEPTDPNAVHLQELISRDGVASAFSQVSGLPREHEVVSLVTHAYEERH